MKKLALSIVALVVVLFFIGCDVTPVVTNSGNGLRQLDVSADSVDTLEVSSYFSMYHYGPTQKFYHIKNENTVIQIRTNNDTDFVTSVNVYVFEENSDSTDSTTGIAAGDIEKWLNNQYSDALYVDAPEPIKMVTLSENQYSLISTFQESTSFGDGQEYDRYSIELTVDSVFDEGSFSLGGFTAEYVVHVMTQGGGLDSVIVALDTIDVEGYLMELDATTFQYGTHALDTTIDILLDGVQLLIAPSIHFALTSVNDSLLLDAYEGKVVRIEGVKVSGYPVEGGPELLQVLTIEEVADIVLFN